MTPFFDEGRDFAPGGRGLPANTSRMAVGAVTGLVADEIEAGRADQLPDLLPEILFASLVPYVGPEAAAKEAEREIDKRLRTPRYHNETTKFPIPRLADGSHHRNPP